MTGPVRPKPHGHVVAASGSSILAKREMKPGNTFVPFGVVKAQAQPALGIGQGKRRLSGLFGKFGGQHPETGHQRRLSGGGLDLGESTAKVAPGKERRDKMPDRLWPGRVKGQCLAERVRPILPEAVQRPTQRHGFGRIMGIQCKRLAQGGHYPALTGKIDACPKLALGLLQDPVGPGLPP